MSINNYIQSYYFFVVLYRLQETNLNICIVFVFSIYIPCAEKIVKQTNQTNLFQH